MRILQLVQKPQRRGAEVFAFKLSEELGRLGQEVRTVYLYPHDGDRALPLKEQDLVLDGRESHPLERFPGVHPLLLRRLKRQIAEFRPHVVQVNGARTVKYGAFCRFGPTQAEWVLIYRNIGSPRQWVRGRTRRWFYRRLVVPRLSAAAAVSQASLRELVRFYELAIPATQIPTGVSVDSRPALQPPESLRRGAGTPAAAPVLLYVGSHTKEKRLERWLRVARAVRSEQPDLVLWLVGDGPCRSVLEEHAASLGLSDSIHFLGVRENVADYLLAADVFLLTSESEGIPAAVLEAGMLGLPVVACRVGGLSECIRNGETGLLVDAEDEAACVEAVLALLRDPDRRSTMGRAARAWCRANFSIESVAQRYLDFYRRVLGDAGALPSVTDRSSA